MRTLATLGCALLVGACASRPLPPPVEVTVFDDAIVHFTPDDAGKYPQVTLGHADNGREVSTHLELTPPTVPQRILARVRTRPIPKDVQHVHDPWDRAGHVRLEKPGEVPVEIVKFVTAYGGESGHEVDVTHLAPLLRDACTLTGFIDTWSSPGWRMDVSLVFQDDPDADVPRWAEAVFFDQEVTAASEHPVAAVTVPPGLERVELHYMVSGHCTDGRGADEFETRDNVITVDGAAVVTTRPWRDDCEQFRAVNPYCRRWSNGTWSSDYSRSGWCPSDVVLPIVFDLTEHLLAGEHRVGLEIRDIRPKDESGHGYWRVSAVLVGW